MLNPDKFYQIRYIERVPVTMARHFDVKQNQFCDNTYFCLDIHKYSLCYIEVLYADIFDVYQFIIAN